MERGVVKCFFGMVVCVHVCGGGENWIFFFVIPSGQETNVNSADAEKSTHSL